MIGTKAENLTTC